MAIVTPMSPPTPTMVVASLLGFETKKIMYAVIASSGTCNAIEMMTHKTVPATMMAVLISRVRVGASSCRNQPTQSESIGRAPRNVSLMSLPARRTLDDCDRGRAHAEKILIRIFDFDADWESLRDADPIQLAFDIRNPRRW